VIRLQGRAVVYGELWFDEEPPAHPDVDIVVHRCRHTPIPNARTETFRSLYTDLTGPTEAIVAGFQDGCRYQIRRAETKDGLRHEVIPDAFDNLVAFSDFYDAFARQKALWPADRHWLARAAAEGQLVLSSASRGDERLVWHAHLRSGRTVRLAYSASCFRGMDSDYRSLVGRANRWLHWRDILYFREAGLERYDWGGIFADESTPERAGINRFKGMFGGQPTVHYECTVPVTVRGRVWLALRDTWRSWRQSPRPVPALRQGA
jgi:Acetyltransferase (GNAT) domain